VKKVTPGDQGHNVEEETHELEAHREETFHVSGQTTFEVIEVQPKSGESAPTETVEEIKTPKAKPKGEAEQPPA
jgi:hypothetical protein